MAQITLKNGYILLKLLDNLGNQYVQKGEVVSVDPALIDEWDYRGNKVIFLAGDTELVKHNKKEYLIIHHTNIVGVL